jgi:hypothetical protein
MFGNLGAFVNGAMFMGLFGSAIGVKVGPDVQEQVRRAGGGPFGPPERPMGGYVTLPATAAPEQVAAWVAAALAYVAALPPKPRSKGTTRATRST